MILSNIYAILLNGRFVNANELYHYGIKGMKWGVRRYQNPDGTLTAAGKKKASQRELDEYGNELLQLPNAFRSNGQLSAQVVNTYNKKMAELMSQKISDIRAPSGRVVSFVAK